MESTTKRQCIALTLAVFIGATFGCQPDECIQAARESCTCAVGEGERECTVEGFWGECDCPVDEGDDTAEPAVEPEMVAEPEPEFDGEICGRDETEADAVWVTNGHHIPEMAPFDELVADIFALPDANVTQASLAVMKDDRLIYARGYRDASDARNNVYLDTKFRIASISKPITGVAIAKLIEDGLLSEDSYLVDYVPFVYPSTLNPVTGRTFRESVDPRLSQITVSDLLYHRGGWDRGVSFDAMFEDSNVTEALGVTLPISQANLISYMSAIPLDHAPGTQYAYSNLGYMLLAKIVEAITAQSYEKYVQDNVFAPLGIDGPEIGATSGDAINEATYNTRNSDMESPYTQFNFDNMDGHGGWIASAEDLAQFAHAFGPAVGSQNVLNKETVEAMYAPHPDDALNDRYYAKGWSVLRVGAGRNTWHTGLLTGTTSVMINRVDGFSWAILVNGRVDSAATYNLGTVMDGGMHAAAAAVTDWPEHDLRLGCPSD